MRKIQGGKTGEALFFYEDFSREFRHENISVPEDREVKKLW